MLKILIEIGIAAAAIAAIVGLFALKPVRWVFNYLIGTPIEKWVRHVMHTESAATREGVERFEKFVRSHLENGSDRKVVDRLIALEQSLDQTSVSATDMHRYILESTGGHVMIADEHQQTVWVSKDAQNLFGMTSAEMCGQNLHGQPGRGWETGIHPDDLPTINGKYNAAFADKRPETWKNMRIVNQQTGDIIWFDSDATPLRTSSDPDKPAGYIGKLYPKTGPTD